MERRKRKWILILVLLLVVGGIILVTIGNRNGFNMEANQEEGSLEGLSTREIDELMEQKVEEGSLAISINSEPHFVNGRSKGTLRIENPVNNRYLIVIKIYLEKSNEKIYESGGIRPGNKLEYDRLDKELEKGRHAVRAEFEAYEQESKEYVGKAIGKLTIVVEN